VLSLLRQPSPADHRRSISPRTSSNSCCCVWIPSGALCR